MTITTDKKWYGYRAEAYVPTSLGSPYRGAFLDSGIFVVCRRRTRDRAAAACKASAERIAARDTLWREKRDRNRRVVNL